MGGFLGDEMSEGYWDGGTWVYHATITNDAMDAADQVYTVVPGRGNEMEILYGSMFNGDTTDRNSTLEIDDGANRLVRFFSRTHTAGSIASFPYAEDDFTAGVAAGPRFILGGTMRLVATVAAVAVSQDSALGLVCRIRGSIPIVTEAASAGVPVISINTEQTF